MGIGLNDWGGIVRDFAGPLRYYQDHRDKDTFLTRALRDNPAGDETTNKGSKRRRSVTKS